MALGATRSPFLRMSTREQLKQPEFICYLLFQAANFLKFSWHITAAQSHLQELADGNAHTVLKYLEIFGIILPVAAVFVIPSGLIQDYLGVPASILALNFLNIALSAVSMIPTVEAQIGTFILTGATRAFIFSTMGTYIAQRFGFDNMGVLLGVAECVGGASTALQFALLNLALGPLGGNFAVVNGVLLGIGVLQLAFPIYLWRRYAQEERESARPPTIEGHRGESGKGVHLSESGSASASRSSSPARSRPGRGRSRSGSAGLPSPVHFGTPAITEEETSDHSTTSVSDGDDDRPQRTRPRAVPAAAASNGDRGAAPVAIEVHTPSQGNGQ